MRNWLKWMALAAAGLAAAPLSSSVPGATEFPGLIENEHVIPIGGNCSLVATVTGTPEEIRKTLSTDTSGNTFSGDCSTGFANGPGTLTVRSQGYVSTYAVTYLYGRLIGPMYTRSSRRPDGTVTKMAGVAYVRGNNYVSLMNLTDFATPDWSSPGASGLYLNMGGVIRQALTYSTTCTSVDRDKDFKRCRLGTQVYGILLSDGSTPVIVSCPDMYNPATCGAFWAKTVAPIVEQARPFIKSFDDDAAALHARLDPLAAQADAVAQKRQADAQAAAQKRQAEAEAETRRAAEAEQARQAEAKRQADAAAAARARADQAFQNSLKTMGPGELFAQADELRRAGEIDKANQMLRALITRFPNSPLAAVAAKQLSESSGPTSSVQPAPRVASTAPARAQPAVPARSCESWMMELNGPNNAGQTPNSVSNIAGRELSVWVMQEYIRLAHQIPQCSPGEIARVQSALAQEQQRCRDAGGSNCVNGSDYRAPQYRQASRETFDRTLAAARGSSAVASAAPAPSSECSATPDQELANFNADMQNVSRVHPMPGTDAGARATYQYSYAYASRGLDLLAPRRACMGRHYQPNYDTLMKMRDTAKQGCDQLSSSSAICPKEFP